MMLGKVHVCVRGWGWKVSFNVHNYCFLGVMPWAIRDMKQRIALGKLMGDAYQHITKTSCNSYKHSPRDKQDVIIPTSGLKCRSLCPVYRVQRSRPLHSYLIEKNVLGDHDGPIELHESSAGDQDIRR